MEYITIHHIELQLVNLTSVLRILMIDKTNNLFTTFQYAFHKKIL